MERGRRTRERIALAMLDLIRAGNLHPTSDEVAQHAGVGHRTVFRHFQDMESLFEEMNAKVRTLAQSALAEPFKDGTLLQRIDALVERRARVYEQITMYYLSGEIRQHVSPTLQRSRAQFAAQQREQLLICLPEARAGLEIAAAAELVTSMDGWLRLRRTQGLDVEQTKRVISSALARLLGV